MTLTTYTVFQNRGSTLGICRPLVVPGRGPAGVPHHQQLCHARDGNTALLRWSLPIQRCLPLPQGKKKVHQKRLKSAATHRAARWRCELSANDDNSITSVSTEMAPN